MNKQKHVSGVMFIGILVCVMAISLFLGQDASSAPLATPPPELEITLNTIKDAHVDQANPITPLGNSVNLDIGSDGTYDKNGLFDFNLSSLPADAEVISATLQVNLEYNRPADEIDSPDADIYTLLVHAITSSWTESAVTWDTRPTSSPLGDPWVDIPTNANGWQEFDVTNIVQSWRNGSQTQYGIMLLPHRDSNVSRLYVSREGSSTDQAKLVIRYTTMTPTKTPTPTATSTATPTSLCPGTVFIYADRDTTTDSSAPTSVYGSQQSLYVGSGTGYTFETFLHFPVEDYFLPGDYIYSADLQMIISDRYQTYSSSEVLAFTLNGTFDETTTNWNNQPFMRKILPVPKIYQGQDFVSWNMTLPVRDWVYGLEENTGLGIMAIDPGQDFWFKFHSREAVNFGDRPVLIIHCGDIEPTPTPTSTNTPTPTPTPIPTDPPPVTLDLEIIDLEITQGLQDLFGSIELISDKRTFIRLHVQAFDTADEPPDVYATTAKLWVFKDGGYEEILRPINNPTGIIELKHIPFRSSMDDSFLFELPSEYITEGHQIRLIGEVNSEFDTPHLPETDMSNNTETVTVTFGPTKDLALGLYEVHYTHWEDGLIRYPSFSDIMTVLARLKNEYPISDTPYFIRQLIATGTGYVGEDDFDWANEFMVTEALYDTMNGETFVNSYDTVRYHALWKDLSGRSPGGTISGKSIDIPGPTGSSFVDKHHTLPHELGHNFGRHHTPECGAKTGCFVFILEWCPTGFEEFPYSDGRLGAGTYEWMGSAVFGFSHYQGTNELVYYPNYHDLMTYCGGRWLSDFTYNRIKSYMGPDSQESVLEKFMLKSDHTEMSGDFLVISGAMKKDPDRVELSPIFVLPDIDYSYQTKRGYFDIVLRNSHGTELARYEFDPQLGSESSECSLDEGDPPTTSLTFFEVVPYHPDTVRLEIVANSTIWASVDAGMTPPTIQVVSPNGGETLDMDPITVTWNANDNEEGKDLQYRVSYSKDNGKSWDLVASGITEHQVTIPQANLPASNRGLFRVWASDGIHTSYDDSDNTFMIPNAVPYLEITSPISGTIYIISQTVTMQANAYDPDIGSLDGDQITWYSTLDGEIGTGDTLSLSNLSIGDHTILAVATDGQGGMAGDSVKITIYYNAGYLPPLPDLLKVAPASVYFNPALGYTSQLLEVYNGNLSGTIHWEVTASDPWIRLPTIQVGRTRSWITVSVNTTGLGFGAYEGSITFTDVEDPENVVVLPVQLYFEPYDVYLPLTFR